MSEIYILLRTVAEKLQFEMILLLIKNVTFFSFSLNFESLVYPINMSKFDINPL